MERDFRIHEATDKIASNTKLLYKIEMGEKISIEEANYILKSMNSMYRKNVCCGFLLIILIPIVFWAVL